MNNWLNKVFSTFNSFNSILYLGCKLLDIFSSYIVFYNVDCSSNKSKISHCKKLDKIILEFLSDPRMFVIISDMSIKNNVASFISHIHFFNNLLKKTLYYAINIISTEAKLFAIRCGISQVVQIQLVSYIIVITDAINIAKKIFDPSIYLHQQQVIAILKDLRVFFNKHEDNTIEFWDCPNDK